MTFFCSQKLLLSVAVGLRISYLNFVHALARSFVPINLKCFFSRNVHRRDRVFISLSTLFEISPTTELGKYLGTPIFTSKRSIHTNQFIADRIYHKIEGWQSKFLYVAGRVTLIKSTSNTIAIFSMQTTLLHRKICQNIDKLNWRFFWGDSDQHRACHTNSWDN